MPQFEQNLYIFHTIVGVKQCSECILKTMNWFEILFTLYVFQLELTPDLVVSQRVIIPYVVDEFL